MSELKATPGPWVIHVEPDFSIHRTPSVYICRSDEPWPHGQLARVNTADEFGSQQANAQIIAAAPDFLRAAKMQARAEEVNANCEECEGEGDWACCSQCSILFGDAIVARDAALAKARGESV